MIRGFCSYCRRIVAALLACLIAIASLSVSVQAADFPDWLGGKPDTVEHADRCALYEWFLQEADSQTNDRASRDDLSRKRVINIANKLADHHAEVDEADAQQIYTGRVKYLVFAEPGPRHFSFRVERQRLEQLLRTDCDDNAL